MNFPSKIQHITHKNKIASTIFVFVTFSLFISGKDLIYRSMAKQEWASSEIIFLSGVGSIIACFSMVLFQNSLRRDVLKVNDLKAQILRIALAGTTAYFITLSFKYLTAGTVSTASKIYIPVLILISQFWGQAIHRRLQIIAWMTIIVICGFSMMNYRNDGASLLGWLSLFLATILVVVEYILLRASSLKESVFWTAFAPSLGYAIFGYVGLQLNTSSNFIIGELPQIAIGLLSGLFLFGAYAISKYRYILFSMGIAEYPSVASAIFTIVGEKWLLGAELDDKYLTFLLIILGLLSLTLFLKQKRNV